MEICVSAGMGMDMAWNLVGDEIRPVCADLADEMALVNLEMHLGSPRADAMRNMADRSGADEIASLATVLVQTEKFGTSVGDALRTFAASMRDERTYRVEEKAEKTAVKLLFPMVLCIFPAVLIVVAGPAVITLIKMMSNY
jgi:tight adherence protein C